MWNLYETWKNLKLISDTGRKYWTIQKDWSFPNNWPHLKFDKIPGYKSEVSASTLQMLNSGSLLNGAYSGRLKCSSRHFLRTLYLLCTRKFEVRAYKSLSGFTQHHKSTYSFVLATRRLLAKIKRGRWRVSRGKGTRVKPPRNRPSFLLQGSIRYRPQPLDLFYCANIIIIHIDLFFFNPRIEFYFNSPFCWRKTYFSRFFCLMRKIDWKL